MKNLVALFCLSLAGAAQSIVLAAVNFDSGFNSGAALQGQVGWQGTGAGLSVTTTQSFSGFFGVTRNPATAGSFAWLETPHNPTTSADKVVAGSLRMRHVGTATESNDWVAGLDAYTFDVDPIGGIQIQASTGRPFILGAQGLGAFLPAVDIASWNLYQCYIDYDGGVARGRVNGVWQQPAISIDQTQFNDFDLYQGIVGAPTSRVYMDDYKVETLTTASLGFFKVSGTITMSDFILPESTWIVNAYVVNPLTNAIVDSIALLTSPTGNYSFSTIAPAGTYNLYFKGGTFLSKKVSSIVIGPTPATGANVTLLNGDVLFDDVVDLSDYTAVALAFNALPSSANWDVRSDMNGDDVIDLTDYTIVAINFNAIGDLAADGLPIP